MTPDAIKQLRRDLRCTAGELAAALDVELAVVKAWEREEKFPTRRFVRAMHKLAEQGPEAVRRKRKKRKKGPEMSPLAVLADPALWSLVRKLLAHGALREDVMALAAKYDDPAEL